MARPPTAQPWTAPRPDGARAAPVIYRPLGPPASPPAAHPHACRLAHQAGGRHRDAEHTVLPVVATWLTVDERLRVDAAGQDAYHTTHFDDLAPLARALTTYPFAAALVSVTLLARGGPPVAAALAELLRATSALPTAALVSESVDLATVLALGKAGVRAVIDVQRPDGWATLRTVVAGATRPDVAQIAARALTPAVADLTSDVQRFVAALFEAPTAVITVRDLARGLGVLPTTLMSRFFRADLPPPKRYLAFARLTRAAYLLRTPAWTVAAVADYLEYSSAQGFSRHLHLLFGIRPAQFRRQYDVDAMLARFADELLLPYRDVLRTFWPLRTGAGDSDTPMTSDSTTAHTKSPPTALALPRTAPDG